jgi:uncharacterized protein YecT (DUF1311 family)
MTSGVRLGGLILATLGLAANGGAPAAATPVPATSVSETSVPASFDCGTAVRAVDRFICADAALRWQDLALSRAYRAARDATTPPARADLVAIQRDWVRERDRRCVADRSFAELAVPGSELHDQAYDCLMIVYVDRRRELGDLAAAPVAVQGIAEIDLRPIARARPELVERGEVRVAGMRLSPDGKLVAILLPSQEIDGPNQLWLYRVADRKLVPATPMPDIQEHHPADAVAAITALAWRGETLFARVALWGDKGDSEDGPTATYAATPDAYHRLGAEPAEIDGHFESISGGLTIRDDEIPEDEAAILTLQGNAGYLIWAGNRGHGTIDLHMRPRSPGARAYLVAWGEWDLVHFLLDGPRSRFLYSADTGIILFDMATRDERRIAGTGFGDRPYAVSADLGALIWSTRHRCGDERLAEPETGAPERFCLAAMTGAARSFRR